MKKWLSVALGVLTAIGGFVDIGDLVTNAIVGSRFGLSLGWVVVAGVLGICVFAEMSGRVSVVTGRPTFDLIRERLGPRVGLVDLMASLGVTVLTFIAEVGGVALALQLVASVNHVLLVPFVAVLVWLVLLRARFSTMENVLGLLGLALVVYVVALFQLGPDWSSLGSQMMTFDKPAEEHWATWAFYAVALFGAAMTPYEVFFFSSGAVEERWKPEDIGVMRANVFIGFPLGGLLSLAIAGCAAVVLLPAGIAVGTLGETGLPVGIALGKIGLAVVLLGFVAATFGAACETGLSAGYCIAQYFGWQWGKFVRPREAARFHVVIALVTVLAIGVLITGVDPILVTEVSVVFSALALPLTYFPVLVVANDRDYMGEHVNGRLANALGTAYLGVLLVVALAAVPLMAVTRIGA